MIILISVSIYTPKSILLYLKPLSVAKLKIMSQTVLYTTEANFISCRCVLTPALNIILIDINIILLKYNWLVHPCRHSSVDQVLVMKLLYAL